MYICCSAARIKPDYIINGAHAAVYQSGQGGSLATTEVTFSTLMTLIVQKHIGVTLNSKLLSSFSFLVD